MVNLMLPGGIRITCVSHNGRICFLGFVRAIRVRHSSLHGQIGTYMSNNRCTASIVFLHYDTECRPPTKTRVNNGILAQTTTFTFLKHKKSFLNHAIVLYGSMTALDIHILFFTRKSQAGVFVRLFSMGGPAARFYRYPLFFSCTRVPGKTKQRLGLDSTICSRSQT